MSNNTDTSGTKKSQTFLGSIFDFFSGNNDKKKPEINVESVESTQGTKRRKNLEEMKKIHKLRAETAKERKRARLEIRQASLKTLYEWYLDFKLIMSERTQKHGIIFVLSCLVFVGSVILHTITYRDILRIFFESAGLSDIIIIYVIAVSLAFALDISAVSLYERYATNQSYFISVMTLGAVFVSGLYEFLENDQSKIMAVVRMFLGSVFFGALLGFHHHFRETDFKKYRRTFAHLPKVYQKKLLELIKKAQDQQVIINEIKTKHAVKMQNDSSLKPLTKKAFNGTYSRPNFQTIGKVYNIKAPSLKAELVKSNVYDSLLFAAIPKKTQTKKKIKQLNIENIEKAA
jgi:hypothetical protein